LLLWEKEKEQNLYALCTLVICTGDNYLGKAISFMGRSF
jgi:hypothetical protein